MIDKEFTFGMFGAFTGMFCISVVYLVILFLPEGYHIESLKTTYLMFIIPSLVMAVIFLVIYLKTSSRQMKKMDKRDFGVLNYGILILVCLITAMCFLFLKEIIVGFIFILFGVILIIQEIYFREKQKYAQEWIKFYKKNKRR